MYNWNTRLETLKEQHTRLQQQKNIIAERKANLEKRIQDLHQEILKVTSKS
jgi:chromosome segregation ATPase